MLRRVHIMFVLSVSALLGVAPLEAAAQQYDPPPVTSSVTVLGPYPSVGGTSGIRVKANLSPVYWRSIESPVNPMLGQLASGTPCNPATGDWLQNYSASEPIPPEFSGRSWWADLLNRASGEVLDTTFGCAHASTPGPPANAAPSYLDFDQALASANVLTASQPSFSPSRRALTGLEFRVWGTASGASAADVTASVDGWSSTAHVERLGYRILIRDLTRGTVLLDRTVNSVGTADDPAVRTTFERTGRIEVTLSTRWNVTSSQIAGNSGGVAVQTTVSPMGEILLQRSAQFDVIQVRSALVKNRS